MCIKCRADSERAHCIAAIHICSNLSGWSRSSHHQNATDIRALITRNTCALLASLCTHREVTHCRHWWPPHGTKKTMGTRGRKLQDSTSHPPILFNTRILSHRSAYLAKVKFSQQFRGRVATRKSAVSSRSYSTLFIN